MNARELIHQLTHDWIDGGTEVEIWAHDAQGQYTRFTVDKVTSTAPGGVERLDLELKAVEVIQP